MDEMDAPVTRRELKEELALTRGELRVEMDVLRSELRTDMADLRTELRTDMADLRTDMADLRTELKTDMADLRTDIAAQHRQLVVDMGAEISRQFGVALDTVRGWIRAVDDQYRDLPKRVATLEANELPDRVKKLEDAVFASPPRKRRRKAS